MSEALPQSENQPRAEGTPVASPERRSRRLMRGLGLFLIVMAALLALYSLVAFVAWQSGQSELATRQAAALSTSINRQIDLARENIQQGSLDLAQRRLEWVLAQAPDQAEALALMQQAEQQRAAPTAPTATPAGTATPTRPPEPTTVAGQTADPVRELQRLQRLSAQEQWGDVVPALETFRQQFPDYARQETDQLIFEAYVALGLSLLEGRDVELGLFYLAQAERLGNLPQAAIDYETWAELYLQGLAFYGANWGASSYYFRDLCLAAPFYQQSCERLQEVLILYGDQMASAMDWCPAEELYREARQYTNTRSLNVKLTEARRQCALATPTPSAPITDTLPFTDTLPPVGGRTFNLPPETPEASSTTP